MLNWSKIKFLVVFYIFGVETRAQIPTIESDDDLIKKQSLIYNHFHNHYDFLIAYNAEGYWWKLKNKTKKNNTVNYQILGLVKNSWQKLFLSAKIKKNEKLSKPKIIKESYPLEKAEILISELSNLAFWSLNNDSLNMRRKWTSDSTFVASEVSDGTSYRFEILTKSGFKVIRSYYPEFFIEKNPSLNKVDLFLRAKNKFETALEN